IEEADSTFVSVDLSPANWTQIISELKLSALTRQLAENTALLECRNNTLNLSLSADLAHLVTTKSKERLLEALQKKLSHDVDVIFTHSSNKESQGATVAVERAEQIALKQQQAIDSINNDPTIELIKSVFDARVIDNSIKPIE
ncbi:MAG TPA: DNA polymerase III subunit gamma/tau, partial [Methylophaga aminisulfidivorans]|nr:DNA polymerase III subunit gamma/tau [Methylophaga aminisulfidivorans]